MHKLGLVVTALLSLTAVTAIASARPITAGVNLGLTQAGDNSANTDPNHTLGLFGRMSFTDRIGAQLEIQRISTDASDVDIRTITGLMVVELGSLGGGHLVPMILAGVGYDHASATFGDTTGHHIEGGLSLEYRVEGGFTVGAGFRLGGRSIDSDTTEVPLATNHNVAFYVPSNLREGDYRSLGAYAGVRF
jgi:hypothetical protein